MLSQKKQTVIYLSTPAENVPTLTVELQNFSSDWSLLCSFKRWRLWKEPVVGCRRWLWKEPFVMVWYGMVNVDLYSAIITKVSNALMCGNWNVRQAVSQQVFRVTTFCVNTCFQSFSTLISRIVGHTAHSAHVKKAQHVHINTRAPPVACRRCSTKAMQIMGSTKQQ